MLLSLLAPSFRRRLSGLLISAFLLSSCQDGPASQQASAPALPPSPARVAAPTDSASLLAPGRAGTLRIGMLVGELRAHYGPLLREVTLRREGEAFPAFALGKVRAPGEKNGTLPAVLLEPLCDDGDDNPDGSVSDHCRIWRLTLRDPLYRTRTGVGVGSTFEAVRLGTPLTFVGPTTMGVAATAEAWQMNFLLNVSGLPDKLPLRRETIPDSVRVVGVQLYR